jgi:hypothetical protein
MKYNYYSIDRYSISLLEIGIKLLLANINISAKVLFRLYRLIDTKALSLRYLSSLLIS